MSETMTTTFALSERGRFRRPRMKVNAVPETFPANPVFQLVSWSFEDVAANDVIELEAKPSELDALVRASTDYVRMLGRILPVSEEDERIVEEYLASRKSPTTRSPIERRRR